jgi:hypothetical protein
MSTTKRDTIDMAREAGLLTWLKPPEDVIERFKAFEALVRADERGSRLHSLQPGQMELSLRREHNGELFEYRYRFTQEQVLDGPYNIIEKTAGRLDAEITAAIRARGNT